MLLRGEAGDGRGWEGSEYDSVLILDSGRPLWYSVAVRLDKGVKWGAPI